MHAFNRRQICVAHILCTRIPRFQPPAIFGTFHGTAIIKRPTLSLVPIIWCVCGPRTTLRYAGQ